MKQLEPILFIVLIFAVFYFLLIRPQRKRQRETQQMQQALQPGTEVVTTAGMYARVVAFEGDDSVLLEVAPGVTCRYLKQAIMRVVPDATTQAAATSAPAVDATPEPADVVVDQAGEKPEAGTDDKAKPEAEAADQPAAETADGKAEPADAAAEAKAAEGSSPDGKLNGTEAKAEESGTAKGDQRSAS
ncbi:MAG TPA: preprotein translocase subunit YajC [Streptosporangiales bacterium]